MRRGEYSRARDSQEIDVVFSPRPFHRWLSVRCTRLHINEGGGLRKWEATVTVLLHRQELSHKTWKLGALEAITVVLGESPPRQKILE